MALGITRRARLAASQSVAASVTLVDATGLTFPVTLAKKYHFRLCIPFTLGATGGFRFNLNVTAAPTNYVNAQEVNDGVTASPGAQIVSVITVAADFANALAVAGNHVLSMEGDLVPSVSGTCKLQFACNTAANAITLIQGGYFEITSY